MTCTVGMETTGTADVIAWSCFPLFAAQTRNAFYAFCSPTAPPRDGREGWWGGNPGWRGSLLDPGRNGRSPGLLDARPTSAALQCRLLTGWGGYSGGGGPRGRWRWVLCRWPCGQTCFGSVTSPTCFETTRSQATSGGKFYFHGFSLEVPSSSAGRSGKRREINESEVYSRTRSSSDEHRNICFSLR